MVNMKSTSQLLIQQSADRAHFNHGWLRAAHSFSFADYYDPQNINWGALRVFNHDVVAPSQGFGTHPHRDMEILTYVLAGELTHRDSMGNVGVVKPGGVQYLSAGTGIQHSEFNDNATLECELVQMWVVPQAAGLEPRYGQVDFTEADRKNRWLVVASGRKEVEAPIAIWQDATCSIAQLDNATLPLALDANRFAFVFLAKGTATIKTADCETATLNKGDSLRLQGPLSLELSGTGELVAWDVPPMNDSI
jgi:redox-sensitive bicupin YhaK (pirin superfamily)